MKQLSGGDPRTCAGCGAEFRLSEADLFSIGAYQVPAPKFCPDCRHMRRELHVNVRNLFRRRCTLTGEALVSNVVAGDPIKVVSVSEFFSARVDNAAFGREVQFDRPFFTQWNELQAACYRPALVRGFLPDQNSEYTNFSAANTNAYLLFNSFDCVDCYYGFGLAGCANVVDGYRVEDCEACYEVVDCRECRRSAFLENCERCEDSYFLANCSDCRNCMLCTNLEGKELHFLNEPVSQAEFEAFRALLDSRKSLSELKQQFETFARQAPRPAAFGRRNENSVGDYLHECRDLHFAFECLRSAESRYVRQVSDSSRCVDCSGIVGGELLYECTNVGRKATYLRFTMQSYGDLSRLTYCSLCFQDCTDLFGCFGLRGKQYCLLNKQYTKDDYEKLVVQVVAHMESTGEWGEFFPPESSVVPYNLSMAQDSFPLSSEEASQREFRWQAAVETLASAGAEVPDRLDLSSDDTTDELFSCSVCSHRFRIIAQELLYLRRAGIALPALCFQCRHERRLSTRLPLAHLTRSCAKCGAEILCAYDAQDTDSVYCESCFHVSER